MYPFDCAKASTVLKAVLGVALLQTFQVAAASSPDHALARVAAADQADRETGPNKIDWSVVGKRDAIRREQVMQLLNAGGIRTAEDYFDAALIFQHGDTMQDAQLALALATVASRMDANNRDARVLAADAWDRVMTQAGKPQWNAIREIENNGKVGALPHGTRRDHRGTKKSNRSSYLGRRQGAFGPDQPMMILAD